MVDKVKPILKKKPYRHYYFKDYPEFKPHLSPIEILGKGAFGGTYFRSIKSAVTNETYPDTYYKDKKYFTPQELKKHKIIPNKHLTKPFNEYDKSVNKYKVKCGQKLEDWQNSKWITHHDPYGWFEWYVNFFNGRRLDSEESKLLEDRRQIDRWLKFAGPQGRFKTRIINMIIKKEKMENTNIEVEDATISPVIRQSLLHWGYEVTEYDVKEQKNKKNKR
jgi:hypothetical protein